MYNIPNWVYIFERHSFKLGLAAIYTQQNFVFRNLVYLMWDHERWKGGAIKNVENKITERVLGKINTQKQRVSKSLVILKPFLVVLLFLRHRTFLNEYIFVYHQSFNKNWLYETKRKTKTRDADVHTLRRNRLITFFIITLRALYSIYFHFKGTEIPLYFYIVAV